MDENKKAKQQIKIIAALLIVFALILAYNYKRNVAKTILPKPDLAEGEFNIETAASNMENLGKKKTAYQGHAYRDPLEKPLEISMLEKEGATPVSVVEQMPEEGQNAEQEFVLEGIIWGDRGKIAIISGEVVVEGETIKSAKVESITEEKVILDRNGKKIELVR